MSDAHFVNQLADVLAAFKILKNEGLHARRNVADWTGLGYPGSSGGARTSDISRPVERIVLAELDKPSRHAIELKHAEIEERMEAGRLALKKAAELVTEIVTTFELPGAIGCSVCDRAVLPKDHVCDQGALNDKDRKALKKACRDRDHKHPAAWQPVYVQRGRPPNHRNAAAPKVAYCSFCFEFIDRYGVEPTSLITLWHLDHLGSRVPHKLIKEQLPAEFDRYHAARNTA